MSEGTRASGEVEMETRRPRWEGEERSVENALTRSEEAGRELALVMDVRDSVRWKGDT